MAERLKKREPWDIVLGVRKKIPAQALLERSTPAFDMSGRRVLYSAQAVQLMRFVRRYWYTLGPPIAIIAIVWAFVSGLSRVQWILLLNFVVLLLHQFEEYAWPGGEPWIGVFIAPKLGVGTAESGGAA